MRRGRKIWVFACKILLVVIFSLALLGACFDLYLRQKGFLDAQPANYICVTGDPEFNHVFLPNCEGVAKAVDLKSDEDAFYKTNSQGFRDLEPDPKKTKVLVIGDSYTEGFGLDNANTFPAQLGRELGLAGLSGIQVLNGGVMGYSTALYKKYFLKKFAPLKPKFVLLNLDISDFYDDVSFQEIAETDAQEHVVAFPNREVLPGWILPYVYSNKSALLRFLHQEFNLWNRLKQQSKARARLDRFIESGTKVIAPEWISEQKIENCAKPLELVARSVMELKRAVEAEGGRFGVHMFPSGYMVKEYPPGKQNISFVQSFAQAKQKDFSWNCLAGAQLVGIFAKLAAKEGFYFHDSFPLINSQADKKDLYFQRDAHWTKKGVALVVKNLAPSLAKELKKGLR